MPKKKRHRSSPPGIEHERNDARTSCEQPPTLERTSPGASRARSAADTFSPFWLLVGALLVGVGVIAGHLLRARELPPVEPAPSPVKSAVEEDRAVGPWGDLHVRTILLEPPTESVTEIARNCAGLSAPWSFPGYDAAKLDALGGTLNDKEVARALHDGARCDTNGCTVAFPLALRTAMSSAVREKLYGTLGRLENMDFAGAVKLRPSSVETWLEDALERADDRAFVRERLYREGARQSFADAEAACARLPDEAARARFVRALFADEALLTHLRVEHGAAIAPLLTYWGAGPRRTKSLEPLFRSLALDHDGGEIDLVHLLPRFARRLLYTYPTAGEEQLNCHWTTLNFGRATIDDAALDEAAAAAAFERDFDPIDPSARTYADAVLLADDAGRLMHSAIYVADNLVFTKNGRSARRPWVLLRLDEVRASYPGATKERWLRRKSSLGNGN